MKLSDVGQLGKLVEEYRHARAFLGSIQNSNIYTLRITFTNLNNQEAHFNLTGRNTEPGEFMKDLVAVVLKHHNLLRTKLTMMGVDDFEDDLKR